MSSKPRLSDAEREQRRAQDRERLKQAAEQLLTSDGWQRWVHVRSRAGLARLSLSNQLLVALARPDATLVAGFKAWLSLGYCVKKGERAIRIIAPMPIKQRDRDSGEETDETRILFKAVSVFDRAQMAPLPSGEPTPLEPPCEPLTGDSHAHLLPRLEAFARSLRFAVSFEAIAGAAGGWCDPKAKRIVVDAEAPANAQLRTLIHETIHALGVGYAQYGRERAEVLVDCVSFVVCGAAGLDVGGETIPYVAGWGEGGALDAVREYAHTIDALARRLEQTRDDRCARMNTQPHDRAGAPGAVYLLFRLLLARPVCAQLRDAT
ncbi:MAG: ArdC-like ssDNA-binding domain-containing protein [Gaiellales bacterium]